MVSTVILPMTWGGKNFLVVVTMTVFLCLYTERRNADAEIPIREYPRSGSRSVRLRFLRGSFVRSCIGKADGNDA